MSKLNINRKIFLEQEELNRMLSFVDDQTEKTAVLGNTTAWGILKTDFVGDNDFKVENGTNSGTVKIANKSYAINSGQLKATLLPVDNVAIPNDSAWYWLRVSHQYRRHELGTVSIDTSGNLVGTGTTFSEVLRGQATDVPTKVKFTKSDLSPANNSGYYEIVDVTDDLNVVLTSATNFVAESDLFYVVIGSTPIDETITVSQSEGLYMYDDCLLELVEETDLDTPPTIGFVQDETFYIARVQNTGSSLTIQDKREEFWSFNVIGVADKLDRNNNLSELSSKSTARTNLEVLSESQSNARYLQKANNLSEISDVDEARSNLNVYSKTESDNISGLKLSKSANLEDVEDPNQSRTNIGALSLQDIKDLNLQRIRLNGYVSADATSSGVTGGDLSFSVTKQGAGSYKITVTPTIDAPYTIHAHTRPETGDYNSRSIASIGGNFTYIYIQTVDGASASDSSFRFSIATLIT